MTDKTSDKCSNTCNHPDCYDSLSVQDTEKFISNCTPLEALGLEKRAFSTPPCPFTLCKLCKPHFIKGKPSQCKCCKATMIDQGLNGYCRLCISYSVFLDDTVTDQLKWNVDWLHIIKDKQRCDEITSEFEKRFEKWLRAETSEIKRNYVAAHTYRHRVSMIMEEECRSSKVSHYAIELVSKCLFKANTYLPKDLDDILSLMAESILEKH